MPATTRAKNNAENQPRGSNRTKNVKTIVKDFIRKPEKNPSNNTTVPHPAPVKPPQAVAKRGRTSDAAMATAKAIDNGKTRSDVPSQVNEEEDGKMPALASIDSKPSKPMSSEKTETMRWFRGGLIRAINENIRGIPTLSSLLEQERKKGLDINGYYPDMWLGVRAKNSEVTSYLPLKYYFQNGINEPVALFYFESDAKDWANSVEVLDCCNMAKVGSASGTHNSLTEMETNAKNDPLTNACPSTYEKPASEATSSPIEAKPGSIDFCSDEDTPRPGSRKSEDPSNDTVLTAPTEDIDDTLLLAIDNAGTAPSTEIEEATDSENPFNVDIAKVPPGIAAELSDSRGDDGKPSVKLVPPGIKKAKMKTRGKRPADPHQTQPDSPPGSGVVKTRGLNDRASKRIKRRADVKVKKEESTLIGARVRKV